MVDTPRIVVITASIGAGHDGAADELIRRLRSLGFAVDRHDFIDLMPAGLGRRMNAAYKRQLFVAPRTWGWFLDLQQRRWVMSGTARLTSRLTEATMLRAIGERPAAVVATYALVSQALGRLRRSGQLRAPAITYLTDMAVHPLHIADGIDTHLAMHSVTGEGAKAIGAADVRVIAPAVRPAFTNPAPGRFDLPQGKPLALIVAGAWGVGEIERTSLDIAATGLAIPVVACGRNEQLYRKFAGANHAIALGWVDDMATLMRTCHVVVQNAGGLSSLEALATGVPVITYRSVPGHGRMNAEALDQAGWVPWIRSFDELAPALERVLREPSPRIEVAAEDPEDIIATIAALHHGTLR